MYSSEYDNITSIIMVSLLGMKYLHLKIMPGRPVRVFRHINGEMQLSGAGCEVFLCPVCP